MQQKNIKPIIPFTSSLCNISIFLKGISTKNAKRLIITPPNGNGTAVMIKDGG